MIDLHAHILPGLDDGPDDLEASVALARAAATAGTATLVATPHIRGDYPFDPARIHPAVEELNARLVEEGVSLDVVPGGEVSITSLLEIDDPTLDAVRLGGSPYVLVESPYTHTGELLERTLFEAQIRGLRPLLAHPERSPCFLGDLDRLERVVDRGVLRLGLAHVEDRHEPEEDARLLAGLGLARALGRAALDAHRRDPWRVWKRMLASRASSAASTGVPGSPSGTASSAASAWANRSRLPRSGPGHGRRGRRP